MSVEVIRANSRSLCNDQAIFVHQVHISLDSLLGLVVGCDQSTEFNSWRDMRSLPRLFGRKYPPALCVGLPVVNRLNTRCLNGRGVGMRATGH